MPTVLREQGLRVVIYSDDHAPAHVHVFGAGETKIALGGVDGAPSVIRTVGATYAEARRAFRLVREKQAYLRERWNEIHG
ncbi:DUF4160 domain-containing protein [Sphingomonas sp. CJ20]